MIELLDQLVEPSTWDWGSVPDYVVAVTAIVSAVLVVRQLSGLNDDRQQAESTRQLQLDQFRSEAQSARANLLLRIDEQFETGGVFRSRTRWVEMRADSLREYDPLAPDADARDSFVCAALVVKFNALWDQVKSRTGIVSPGIVREYHLATHLPNWIETIGMLARDGLIPVSDLKRLYGATIAMTMRPIEQHLAHRRLTYPDSTAFENALWLNDAIARP